MPSGNWQLYPGEFTVSDWKEAADLWSPNQMTLSRSKNYCTVSAFVDWTRLKACVQYLLGYAYTSSAETGYKLKRVTPAYHPIWTWLYCTQITEVRGFGPDGADVAPYTDSFTPGKYEKFKVTAVFEQLPFKVKEDSQVTTEDQRFFETLCKPYTELVVVEGGQLLWAANASTPTFNGKPVSAPSIRVRQEKTAVDMIWHDVPYDFIADQYDIPTKLLAMQKKVNLTAWRGFLPGTLLCEDVIIEKGNMPIASDVFDDLLFSARVTFKMIWYDPPFGTGETKRGWNLFPRVGDGKYYYAVTATGDPLFQSYEFANAFTSVSV